MNLVSKKDFAELAGISKPAVSKMVRIGKIPVTDDGKINIDDTVCREYLKTKGANLDTEKKKPESPGNRAAMFARRKKQGKSIDLKSEPDKRKKGKTLSDVMSRRDLEMQKLAAQAQNLELKNAQIEGRLVSREAMVRGVWNPLETFLVRILTDGVKTMASTVHPLVKSDGTREEVELALRSELTSFIQPLKESIQKALKLDDV